MPLPGESGLREILVVAIVVLVAYLAVLVIRLARLRRDPGAPVPPPAPAQEPPADVAALPHTNPQSAVASADRAAAGRTGAAGGPRPPPAGVSAAPSIAPGRPAPALPSRASPAHEEAAALARQGQEPAVIARRCGITLSEAELVCWLARNQEQP
jgi:hypothetical protein